MSTMISLSFKRSLLAVAGLMSCLGAQAATAVTSTPNAVINIVSRDPEGTGFTDPTVVEPVGGNPGTTLGQQRMNVYRRVADIWQQNLHSNVVINVSAGWEELDCTANQAVLGSASAWNIWHDFPGGKPNTYYPQALANKLFGGNLSTNQPDDGSGYGNFDIKTQFNSRLGAADCLANTPFYLGFDGKAGNQVNFVETLLHELGHGLGFSVLTDTSAGYRIDPPGQFYVESGGVPSIWEGFMIDNTTGKTWLQMTNNERKASAINPLKLAWNGPNVAAGQGMLAKTPVIQINTPAPGATGMYDYGASQFGPAITSPSMFGKLAVVATQSGESGPGCDAFNAANTAAVAGKVAIISRGTCAFTIKVKNAQNAGAIGVLLANNQAGMLSPSGTDATITIPSALVSQADGSKLKAAVPLAVPYGSRSTPGSVTAMWAIDASRIAGADSSGRPLLYTPAARAPGSSVSHWDVTATPNLLMEPNINSDLGTVLEAPKDLTLNLLRDLGW